MSSKTNVISCLCDQWKSDLGKQLPPNLARQLATLPACPDDAPIGFSAKRGKRQASGTRRPSPYQEFISQCMREQGIKSSGEAPAAMRHCAAAWRNTISKRPS